jgi:hypothetical protein
MTKAEVLKVCDELAKLIAAGPVKDAKKAARAAELVEAIRSVPGLGQLARTTLVDIATRSEIHFNSAKGFQGMKPEAQRARLKSDVETLRGRLEEELSEEADYGDAPPK